VNRIRHIAGKVSALILFAACLPFMQAQQKAVARPQVIGYVFARGRLLSASELSPQKLTRIQYAFLHTKDGELADVPASDAANFVTLIALKRINPSLQVVASIGGGSHSDDFSDIALTPESRARFAASCLRIIAQFHLDGVDIDWEYPAAARPDGKYRAEDKQNYTLLMRDLRAAFDRAAGSAGPHLVLSTATNGKNFFLRNTEMGQVAKYVDTVTLMGYDFYNRSNTTTGNASALYTDPADPKLVSDDGCIRAYLDAGVPAAKLVLGVPFYGHGWKNIAPANHGLFQPAAGSTIFDILYTDIAAADLTPGSGYIRYWDDASAVPYLYNAATHTFITYEDAQSLTRKAAYVREHQLGGMMFWASDGDAHDILLNAINAGLGRKL